MRTAGAMRIRLPSPGARRLCSSQPAVKLSGARAVVEGLNETLMSEQTQTPLAAHGSSCLPSVEVDCYNAELKDENGFLGDRASKGAFRDILEKWRKPLRKAGEPFGNESSDEISKKKLDTLLEEGHPDAAGALQGAI